MPRPERPPIARSTPFTGLAVPAWLGLMVVAALVVYGPALAGRMLWDDSGHVTNPELQSWRGLWRIWFEVGVTQQYYPLLHSAFWVEYRLWGDSTLGYHLINVLQHATAATLFGLLLRRLYDGNASLSAGLRAFDSGAKAAGQQRRRYAGAEWFAAWLFLLHPVCVESVAWISEQKNTLSLLFYLGAALAYLRFDGERSSRNYALATLLFACALLTKTVTASLPAGLLVVFWWQRGRLDWRRDVGPLLPWFALGAGSGLFTAHFERVLIGAQGTDFTLGAMDRLVLAGRVFWFYLGKLAWPADLIFVYPHWNVDAAVGWQWLFPIAGLALLAGLAWWSRRTRGPLAAALLFGGSLFPVLGFFNVYPFVFSYVADHFQYLASLAVFAVAGVGLSRLPPNPGKIIAMLLAGILGLLTWSQASIYRDNDTLYEATLRWNPDAWLAHQNLAISLMDRGQPDAALPHIERTLVLRPDYPQALNNLGNCLRELGRTAAAVPPFERAIQLQPKYAEAYNNLGVALMSLGRTEEGRSRFETAVRLQPDYGTARRNLGLALAMAGRTNEALPNFERAVQLLPDDVASRLQLGMALRTLSRPAEALPHLQAALEIAPDLAQVHLQLALTLHELGREGEATAQYQQAVALDPSLAR